jgi:pimeloyl-ACP methyl ester carboxylesterase
VLTGLGIDQAYFAGHSTGTCVMFQFAHLYPEQILGMISVDGAVSLDSGFGRISAALNFAPSRRIGEVFLTRYITKERVSRILKSVYYQQNIVTAEVVDGYYNRPVTGQWSQSLLAMTRDTSENTITFALEDFQFPMLILWG